MHSIFRLETELYLTLGMMKPLTYRNIHRPSNWMTINMRSNVETENSNLTKLTRPIS